MNREEGALAGLERIARERGDAGLAADIAEARTSAESGQFTLAALGQFKRGKSTLLNALLNRTFFPTVALKVLGGDPPITGDELRLVRPGQDRQEEAVRGGTRSPKACVIP